MIDLSIFNEDELEYIVNVIPRNRAVNYLQKNSKEFAKIKPGFRANALPDSQLFPLLYKELQKGNDFIVTLVLGFLKSCVQEITDAYNAECQKRDETTALIYTLNGCYFRDRLDVYFKLVNQEISQGEIDKLVVAMDILQESVEIQESMRNELAEKEQQIRSLEQDADDLVADKERWAQEKEKIVSQNEELKAEIATFSEQNEKLRGEVAQHLEQNQQLKKQLEEIKTSLLHKEAELQELSRERESLSGQLKEQTERNHECSQKIEALEQALTEQRTLSAQHTISNDVWSVSADAGKYFVPVDLEEFKELISYYLEDSGIAEGSELLISYITKIAFSGKPIAGNRQDCHFLVNCLSNVLTNGESTTLNYSDEVTIADISNALKGDCRVVYLDNFIGNFNETVLYSLLENYHNKIIVISAMFDRTFNYVGSEFLSLCHYFNVSRLKYKSNVEFDVSSLEEKEYVPTAEILQNIPTSALKSILKELRFSVGTRKSLITNIDTHDDATGVLAFCVIPYLLDVCGINPYNSSEKFNDYCEKNHNKYLLNQWFEHE